MNSEALTIELTQHAKVKIIDRKIELEWIAEAILNPIHTEPHISDPYLTYTYGKVTAYNKDRVLKVVYNKNTTPWKVITCYFDRQAKRRLLC